MTAERIIIAILILIGIAMCIIAVIAAVYWGLFVLWAILLFIGGLLLIFLTIVAYFMLI